MRLDRICLAAASAVVLTACGGDGGGGSDLSRSLAFPAELAIASPFDYSSDESSPLRALTPSFSPAYASITAEIDAVLNGTTAVSTAFDAERFFFFAGNAPCFGPSVMYENHPGAATPNSGELPGGDLGIWLETDTQGNACAAAQLNSQMNGTKQQTQAGLMMVASMLSVANSSSVTLPAAGANISLASDMNSTITDPNINILTADIAQSSAGVWNYHLLFTYLRSGYTHKLNIELDHTPGTSADVYSGLLAYWIGGDNTHFQGGNCPSVNDRTFNGSLNYDRTSATAISAQSRTATFCGTEIDGRVTTPTADQGMVDDDLKYNGTNSGWSENFSLFATQFNPDDMSGKFTYAWQAGHGDSASRIFNIGVSAANGSLTGESYFGYGDSIEVTDGYIQNFICNWAGPRALGTDPASLVHNDRVQRQHVTLDSATGIFAPTNSGASNILYAPTDNCDYDGSDSFIYDSNADRSLVDETHGPVSNGLWNGTVENIANSDTLPDIVIMRGFTVGTIPGGMPVTN